MVKIFFISVSLLIFTGNIYCQEQQCRSIGATPENSNDVNYIGYNDHSYTLKVKFWLVGDDNGANRFDRDQISNLMNLVNSVYNPYKINFVNVGVDKIQSTRYNSLDVSTQEEFDLSNTYSTPDVIDFFIVDDLINSRGAVGEAGFEKVWVERRYALTTISAHELGHVIGLTHVNNGGESCDREDFSNCNVCFDKLCDTNPSDTHNLMYSADLGEYSELSESQINYAKNIIEFGDDGAELENVRTDYVPYIRKYNELYNRYVCLDNYTTFSLVGNFIYRFPVTWTCSSNLKVIDTQGNVVSVKGLSNGTGTLTATFNNMSVTATIKIGSPTDIQTTPYLDGYIISCSQPDYYQIDYVDLITNQADTIFLNLTSSSEYSGSNYFYYVTAGHRFKYRLINYYNCNTPSDWITVDPIQCAANNYPADLAFTTNVACGGEPGHSCGYGQFSYSEVLGATLYSGEYMGINLTNSNIPPVSGTFQTTEINTIRPTAYTSGSGTWVLKYRVRSRCPNGTWSDYSPWSQNFAW